MRIAWPLVIVIAACTSAPPPPPTVAASARPSGTPAAGAWRRVADIPTPRSEVASAVYGLDTVYVIGGFGGPSRVERYDPAADRWQRVADLPQGVDHAMAAGVSGLQGSGDPGVYVLGGYVNGAASARAFRYDPGADRWTEIAPMPAARAAGAAVAVGGRVYVVGGADGGRLVSPTYEYDVTQRRWRTLAAIPTPRDHLAAVELHGRVCAVAGRRLSLTANVAALECYLPDADRWERLADAPTPRGGVGAAAWDGRIYLVGGEQPSGTFKEVEIYDERTAAWTRGPDLPTPRHGLAVVTVCCTSVVPRAAVLVLAGGPTPGGSQTAVGEALDPR